MNTIKLSKKISTYAFTPAPTLALLQSVFNKIKSLFLKAERKGNPSVSFCCNKNTTQKLVSGFTLVEALVAISVLMVAVVSPLTIAQKGLSSAMYSKDQMIASYLAQDAIEYIKYVRDENVDKTLSGTPTDWLYGFANCIQDNRIKESIDTFCTIDTTSYDFEIPARDPDNADLYIKTDDASGNFIYYTHDSMGNEKSKFKRKINIRHYVNDSDIAMDEALITVRVYWDGANSDDNSVTVKTYIYNLGESLPIQVPVSEP